MTHWDGATGTEFARDTRVELDIKGEEGPTRDHEKGDGLFRKGAQGERWGGQSKKKMHPGGFHCQFPGYDMGRCYYPGTMSRLSLYSYSFLQLHVYLGKLVFMDHEPLLDHELFRLRNSRK